MPWPTILEWLAWFRIDAEAQEKLMAEARENARVEQRLKDMQGDPYFRRTGPLLGD